MNDVEEFSILSCNSSEDPSHITISSTEKFVLGFTKNEISIEASVQIPFETTAVTVWDDDKNSLGKGLVIFCPF